MLKSVSLATLALLTSDCNTKRVSFRPPQGAVPWHAAASQPSWDAPTWKVDYVVPNFGAKDVDVSTTQNNNAAAEKSLGHVMAASFAKPKEPPRDYFVPNFGADKDIIDAQAHIAQQEAQHGTWTPTQDANGAWNLPQAHAQLMQIQDDPICNSSGCTQYKHKHQKPDHDVDYPVPSYGPDQDIATTQKNIADLEVKFPSFTQIDAQVEREPLATWSPINHKSGNPQNYFVPNFGPKDVDISTTYGDLDLAEKNLGHKWNWSKAGKSHDKDYFVPNFGRDADINDSIDNLNEMQNKFQHTWVLPAEASI